MMKLDLKRTDIASARQELIKQSKMCHKERLMPGTLIAAIFFRVAGPSYWKSLGLPTTIFSSMTVAQRQIGKRIVREE
jgi:hypothetical protein